ncbi:MraY family glycosyltransferase [Pedobacter caeni]|uniref:UDP-N-acetylmuramyl pentapeptide phosphotransferase/UDP-N-acetylglucosamine-1-phosphate transferase n=1 Tax=Pedobacter caeni TaxID=288992 RepID=A0A1M4ZGM8_9SPHI|nr:MraY family glycosyltransferase [Pedobacter caeni]SHF17108.1 UDP-N-acetylmuramyl pentapeptide phosphotransferase/UDP-N-acetylglucosamine-1-phosphate transferase [Pedobacter caeni]
MECIGYFIFSFLLVVLLLPVVIRLSALLGLFDELDAYRKKHEQQISRLGGIAIFTGVFIPVLLFLGLKADLKMLFFLASCFLLFMLGLSDDVCGISPLLKFFVQLLCAVTLVLYGGHNEPVMVDLDPGFRPDLAFLVFFLVLLMNVFNLIDGLDGLAATLGVFVNLFFGVILFIGQDHTYAAIAFTLSGSLAGFLLYNFSPARIFMGDAMAMVTGLISGLMALRFMKLLNSGGIVLLTADAAMAIAISVLIVPVFDGLRVFLIRLLHRKPPFKGDRNHVHHRLKLLGYTDRQVVLCLFAFNVSMLGLTLLLRHLGSFTLIFLLFLICILSNGLLTFLIRKMADKKYRLRDVLLRDTLNIRGS